DRPFFSAKRLFFLIDWRPAFALKPNFTISSVEMSDWSMLVEKWPDEHNFPKFGDDEDKGPAGPRRFTVTMLWFGASRGQFAYEDHEAPWSVVCRNLDITIGNLPQYHGVATFSNGTISIQDHLPMWATMKAQFTLDGPRVHLQRIDLDSDGAKTVARGEVDLAHWPEQTYDVQSRVKFQRMREVFFKNEPWPLSGDGDFNGKFHLFKNGRDLAGDFTSDELGVYGYRFSSLYGSLHWTPATFDVVDAGATAFGGQAAFTYEIKPLGAKTRPTSRFAFKVDGADLAQATDFQELPGQRFGGTVAWQNTLEWPIGRFDQRHGDGRFIVMPPSGTTPMTPSLVAAK